METTHKRATEQPLRRLIGFKKGRQAAPHDLAAVRALLPHAVPTDTGALLPRDQLIEALHAINDHHQGLPEGRLVALAQLMKLPLAEVFEVATFYHHFEVRPDAAPAPRLTVRVCESPACAMAGSAPLLASLAKTLGAEVRLRSAPCIGRCEQAPAVQVGPFALPQATAAEVQAAVAALTDPAQVARVSQAGSGAGVAVLDQKALFRHIQKDFVAPEVVAYAAYRAAGGYGLAAAVVQGEMPGDEILAALDAAGLRGLGGAGFPSGRKWRIVREQAAPRLLAVNIDEGEPGTFKDRFYLERDPHRFLEGLLIAAQVVGCEAVYLYLRDEYAECRALLQRELAALQAEPPCPLPRIELRRGAGAYICGEESAMIESLEGKRGEPRLRPPYIAERGLFGRPTLEHNFETLYWVRDIVEQGAAAFAAPGRHGRKGLRSYSVSGRVRQPGVKRAPAGITLRELVDEYCGGMADGHTLYGFLPGGASGGIFPAALADVPLDFDTLQPHGGFIGSAAVIVFSQHDRARDLALNVMRFFEHESCGQCTPCRVGTAKAAALMAAPVWDATTLEDLSQVMADASICGLGQAAPNPVRCVLRYFPQEVSA